MDKQVLFAFFSGLYERLSLILTTNLKFADWVQVFGDEQLTAALLDRLTHHSHIIELVGDFSNLFLSGSTDGGRYSNVKVGDFSGSPANVVKP